MILCPNSGDWCDEYKIVGKELACDCSHLNKCKHEFEEVKTYIGYGPPKPENIIAVNYQCTICGKVFSEEEVPK